MSSIAFLRRSSDGRSELIFRQDRIPVAIGPGGVRADKQEGDMATPRALMPLRRIYYRADRVARPETFLPCEPLSPHDGWCDDPSDARYNQAVTLPCGSRHERLWRDDHAYDLIAVLGWNDDPATPGRGSAIFMHLPTPGGSTEGCIALPEALWRSLLKGGLTAIDSRDS
ncbi:L,D-transpeptidase family protein [Brytella acorum]|uniref:L,D-transpeptidase family protein n=1 Tax=Brytella acorum TaxID=2959299 RepID=A0AA35URG5_9PROT|nr:L,D-transpeptidase family protein [Brytella acorum]MDF3623885.1 L,D-transpeptidase family protein [Brytella acorum]CAI9120801.1 L,D-transpeptidase family protein [Brytella acorum]